MFVIPYESKEDNSNDLSIEYGVHGQKVRLDKSLEKDAIEKIRLILAGQCSAVEQYAATLFKASVSVISIIVLQLRTGRCRKYLFGYGHSYSLACEASKRQPLQMPG